MNVTFLLGNGFDVGLGLPTKYSNFYPIYKLQKENSNSYFGSLAQEIFDNIDQWSDYEKALGQYTEKFTEKNKKLFHEQNKDFQKEFVNYLKLITDDVIYDEKIIIPKFKQALTKYYSANNLLTTSSEQIVEKYRNSVNENITYNFISFNYTNTIDKCIETFSKKERVIFTKENRKVFQFGKIVHVHGMLEKFPLFGVADKGQIANEIFRTPSDIKRLVKPVSNSQLGTKNEQEAITLINNSSIICVYGMSIGDTDKNWWDVLLQWLLNSSHRQLILFAYDENFDDSSPYMWFEKQEELLDKLFSFNQTYQKARSKIENRIHIAVHKNIFKMDLTTGKKLLMKKIEESA